MVEIYPNRKSNALTSVRRQRVRRLASRACINLNKRVPLQGLSESFTEFWHAPQASASNVRSSMLGDIFVTFAIIVAIVLVLGGILSRYGGKWNEL